MKLKNFFSVKFLPQIYPQIYVSGGRRKGKKKLKVWETFPSIIGWLHKSQQCERRVHSSPGLKPEVKLTSIYNKGYRRTNGHCWYCINIIHNEKPAAAPWQNIMCSLCGFCHQRTSFNLTLNLLFTHMLVNMQTFVLWANLGNPGQVF